MIKEMWSSFPRLIEQNINGLLDTAEPNNTKAFMLYKACKSDDVWSGSFEKFSERISDFFARPRTQRKKSQLDALLDRPMHSSLYKDFHLNFRTAYVSEQSVYDIASWAYNLIRVSKKAKFGFASIDVLNKTLLSITNPSPYDKAEEIEFEDFCAAWKKVVFKIFGANYEPEFESVIKELEWLNDQLTLEETREQRQTPALPTISLTQTEIDWARDVRMAVLRDDLAPKFPLSRGPEKQFLIDLERVMLLYNKARTTNVAEVLSQRDRIRATLLERCEKVLGTLAA